MTVVIDPEARQILASDVERGERLLWAGRPAQGLRLRAADAFMIPFSIMWGGFAIVWEAGALGFGALVGNQVHGAGWFLALWGVPFVAIGLYLMVGRFFWDSYERARTAYGVTESGILIQRRARLTRLDLATLPAIQLSGTGERGSLTFGVQGAALGPAPGWSGSEGYRAPVRCPRRNAAHHRHPTDHSPLGINPTASRDMRRSSARRTSAG